MDSYSEKHEPIVPVSIIPIVPDNKIILMNSISYEQLIKHGPKT